MIELIDLCKTYGDIHAVDLMNLHVSRGEIFGFIGPNGAGKTTTIQMMGGLLAPTSGSVMIDGISMAQNPVEAKKKIGLIPDRPYLYDKLTGLEFLRFTGDIYGVSPDLFSREADRLLSLFSLKLRADELIASYSHGMKQRLIMASALLHDPPILIVDEPMVGLDPGGIALVKNLFKTLASQGKTIFMSTHTLVLAEDLCHRIGVIHQGRLAATGTLGELKSNAKLSDGNLESIFFELTA
jgi:ABC-2 type transport system ATP-binding protein